MTQKHKLVLFKAQGLFLLSLCSVEVLSQPDDLDDVECIVQDEPQKESESSSEFPQDQVIRSINIEVNPIFDKDNPEHDVWLYHLANRLHIKTKKDVIKDDLLFKEGDVLDQDLLNTTERLLNTRRYLTKSTVTIPNPCEDEVDVDVSVRDVWTLQPKINFSHSGGESKYSYAISDSNFLGSGRGILIKRFKNAERTGNIIEYTDPNIGYYNSRLDLGYSENDDGNRASASLIRPFRHLSTAWTGGIDFLGYEQDVSLYNAGDSVDNFSHISEEISVFWGKKLNQTDDHRATRLVFGYSHLDDEFSESSSTVDSEVVPTNRLFDLVWLEYQRQQDHYIKTFNIQQINRAEYINLGSTASFRLGYSPTSFQIDGEEDKPAIHVSSHYSRSLAFTEQNLLLSKFWFGGYYIDDEEEKVVGSELKAHLSYHWKNFSRGQLYVKLEGVKGYNLFKDQLIVLGGENGLRGYPSNYQSGDKSVLFTMEQRFFGKKEWLSLFHAGFAMFVDSGRAWGETPIEQDVTGWLTSVGIGLRLSGTRTGNRERGSHQILHLDIISPLNRDGDISSVQWRAKTEQRF